ncbi:hypothetical protein LP420_23920 [Massilia sp. B-10]|nr:hypothetical protein LP420_23920 [Massilia sp. B-10]
MRGKKVGTVVDYRYRYLEPVLGKDFVRDDAPSVEHALRKLMAGRTQYTLMELSTAAWHVKNDAALRLDITYENSRALRLFQAVERAVRRCVARDRRHVQRRQHRQDHGALPLTGRAATVLVPVLELTGQSCRCTLVPTDCAIVACA